MQSHSALRVAGVDGTKGGWAAIVLDNGVFARDELLTSIDSEFAALSDAKVIGVDVPIGYGPREADRAARAFLTGGASTVFTTPPRSLLEMQFGPGLGLSAQSHALGPRIIHVTELAARDPRFREVHPEVSFRAMNRGRPLRYRKKSAGGALERIELLRHEGITLANLASLNTCPLDDVLDAAASSWSAHRIATGVAVSLPAPPQSLRGRDVAIWY